MAYLIAILLYLGIISSPIEINQQMIDDNKTLIEEVESQEIVIIDDSVV